MLVDGGGAGDDLLDGELRRLHGGPLRLGPDATYANFVCSADGVVALGDPSVSSGPVLSGRNEGDRFLMGLLRACADAVLIGASTLRDDPGHLWTPGYVFPDGAEEFAALRRRLGLAPEPMLAVATVSGRLDTQERALRHAAVLTTSGAAERLRSRVSETTRVVAVAASRPTPRQLLGALRELGCRRVLVEAGPHMFGEILSAGLVGELFLTLSPVIAGRRAAGARRLGLVEGVELLPGRRVEPDLVSARRLGSHLFLRYRFAGG